MLGIFSSDGPERFYRITLLAVFFGVAALGCLILVMDSWSSRTSMYRLQRRRYQKAALGIVPSVPGLIFLLSMYSVGELRTGLHMLMGHDLAVGFLTEVTLWALPAVLLISLLSLVNVYVRPTFYAKWQGRKLLHTMTVRTQRRLCRQERGSRRRVQRTLYGR